MDGLPAPPPAYVLIPNRRLKERFERQKNWALMTPEEILLDSSTSVSTSLEDSSKPAGRQEKDKRSRLDDSSSAREPDLLSPDSSADSDRSAASRKRQGQSGSRDEADLPADVKESEKELRDLQKTLRGDSDSNPFSTVLRANTGFSEFFGPDTQKSSWLDQVAHDKAVMDQFKQAVESPLSPQLYRSLTVNPVESMFDLAPGIDSLKSTPLVRSPFSRSDGLDLRPNAFLPPSPGLSDDKFAGPSSALSTQPRFQPAQQPMPSPPTPTFVFPKRVFQ